MIDDLTNLKDLESTKITEAPTNTYRTSTSIAEAPQSPWPLFTNNVDD